MPHGNSDCDLSYDLLTLISAELEVGTVIRSVPDNSFNRLPARGLLRRLNFKQPGGDSFALVCHQMDCSPG